MLEGLNSKLQSLQKCGVIFINMCAEGQTPDGQRFIEFFLNLKPKNITKDGYKLHLFDSKEKYDACLEKTTRIYQRIQRETSIIAKSFGDTFEKINFKNIEQAANKKKYK